MQERRTCTSRLDGLLARSGLSTRPCAVLVTLAIIIVIAFTITLLTLRSVGSTDDVILDTRDAGATTAVESEVASETVFIDVEGAVRAPGVYELDQGSRVIDAVSSAQGTTENADTSTVNLARVLTDGERVYIPRQGEVASSSDGSSETTSAPININTATSEELCTLSGIGEATASKIIADRERNGPFTTTDDLMRVPGIGEGKYAQIEDDICV